VKITDAELFLHYLSVGAPDAALWNLSPESLGLEATIRGTFVQRVKPKRGCRALNIGIGAGAWDDFLGYWLEGQGSLFSLDTDERIASVLAYRQWREGHTNPAHVLVADAAQLPFRPGSFDLVVMVGSTLTEAADAKTLLARCLSLVRPGGLVYLNQITTDAPHLVPTDGAFSWTEALRQDGALKVSIWVGERQA
jgi:ubiquinone/menaquinone biosynthesis C-methylase UbiE